MTPLLDRYLNAIEEALPNDVAKDDVVAEIREELESQFEARSAELGNPLTEDDQASIFRAYGHPRVVATRYGRVQYLIGPDIFPFYWETMRNTLTIGIALVLVCGGLAAVVMRDGAIFFDALGVTWSTALWIVAVITIIFAVAEHVPQQDGARVGPFSRAWDPRRLSEPSTLPPAKRYSALIEFVANVIALLVLLDARGSHRIPLDASVANILAGANALLTPAWYPAYWATIAGSAIIAASAIAVFLRPNLTAKHELFRSLAGAITIGGIAVTLANGPWIVAPSHGWNTSAEYCLIAAILVLLISIGSSLRQVRLARTPPPANN